ncbi:MAG TPA: Fe2+-dependent dioxygenase [Burkholderiaceae bacterium]|nr:Fe2+-dependent dioxygenase [Burkholderiaceae bacterium]
MLIHIPAVLNAEQLREARQLLADASWSDGRATAGAQAAQAKNNEQLPADCAAARTLQAMVLRALDRQPTLFSAALPKRVFPPSFNRYSGGANFYGEHVDRAVRFMGDSGQKMRTDLSCTLFLSEPADYDGGELVIQDGITPHRIKLAAGDLVLYPGTTVHQVTPVTRGQRLACFFWIESMVRGNEQRRLLFDMDTHLMTLRSEVGETHPAVVGLTGTYHNLLRLWTDT